jgi:hypothetical protein
MLDQFSNQASGLIGLGCQSGPRMVAMVSHGDELAELPMLWQLCLSLVNFGYSVTVLDATTAESDTNPGLVQLLENALWGDDSLRETPAWTVLPSAQGIQTLLGGPHARAGSLRRLGHLMPAESIVVLYCNVEWMAPLIGDWHAEPLLAVSPNKTSLLTGYIALKRLLITGKLKPTIVNMQKKLDLLVPAIQPIAFAGLGECVKRFLGHELKTVDITEQTDVAPCAAAQQLALRLLESAVPLGAASPSATLERTPSSGHFAQFAGSH